MALFLIFSLPPYNNACIQPWGKSYTTDPDKPFRWIRGRQVGGRSILWGRQCYRWSDLDFTANLRDGIAIDWPIRYADLAPWYDYVKDFIGISGEPLGLPQLPDSKFLPPMQLACVEHAIKESLAKNFGNDRVLTIGRVAVLTQTHRGRAACLYCGPCQRGCITQSYFSRLNATLRAAEKTGRLTLRPYSTVHSLAFDSNTRRISGVKDQVGAWGIPTLKIHCAFGENEYALRKDMAVAAAEMLAAAGAHSIEPFTDDDPPGFSIHEMGTARMGRDAKTSVLNSWNQSHDIKNLFITDGACMTSSSCVNPSLTYMTLTARSCNHAVNLMKRHEL